MKIQASLPEERHISPARVANGQLLLDTLHHLKYHPNLSADAELTTIHEEKIVSSNLQNDLIDWPSQEHATLHATGIEPSRSDQA